MSWTDDKDTLFAHLVLKCNSLKKEAKKAETGGFYFGSSVDEPSYGKTRGRGGH